MTKKILFFGQGWQGSNARSLREALSRRHVGQITDIVEDTLFPGARHVIVKAVNRLALNRFYFADVQRAVLAAADDFDPDIFLAFKGWTLHSETISTLKNRGILTVNYYPDYSPHVFGKEHTLAVGAYDLVVSSKARHPSLWHSRFGYSNICRHVPHGYDPVIHLRDSAPKVYVRDVGMIATWRPQYHNMMKGLAELLPPSISVGVVGNKWVPSDFPKQWQFLPRSVGGHSYADWLRSCRIVIAPTNAGDDPDEDTARTYELAAAHCFFIHRRTPLLPSIYDEDTEVPAFDSVTDLAEKIVSYLAQPNVRQRMAAAAHARAVPAYSWDARATQLLNILMGG